MLEVIILSGLPGSGKSTWAEKFKKEHPDNQVVIISSDRQFVGEDGVYRFDPSKIKEAHGNSLRYYISCVERLYLTTTHDVTIIVDNTNLTVEDIAPYYAVADAWNVSMVHVLHINPPKEGPLSAHARNVHGVPLQTFVRMTQNWVRTSEKWPHRWRLSFQEV
jgi:predicted kinase